MNGVHLQQHHPVPREIALESPPGVVDPKRNSWESLLGYLSVLKDGDVYRMYYRHVAPKKVPDGHEFFCYAESRDAIEWTKPNLRLFTIPGSDDRNAITEENMAEPGDEGTDHTPCISHNMRPFIDTRPGVPEEERYKALGGGFNSGSAPAGYWALVSADGRYDSPSTRVGPGGPG